MVFSQYYKVNGVEKEMWYSKDVFQKILKRRIQRTIERQKKNKEKHASNIKKWRSMNPEKAKRSSRESSKTWRKNNPEKSKIKSTLIHYNRKAMKLSQLHPEHDKNKEAALVRLAKALQLEIDHIVPLSRGGLHWHKNLRLLPKSLNASKNKRLDSELSENDRNEVLFWQNLTKVMLCSYFG